MEATFVSLCLRPLNNTSSSHSGLGDCVATIFLSLRTTEGSAAICVLSMAYKIASVVSLLRNDIATQSLDLESRKHLITLDTGFRRYDEIAGSV